MKTRILLFCSAILLSMSLQAQNTIEIVNPPPTVEGNTKVDITFNYTLDIPGYVFLRFKNGTETANNITAVSMELPAGTGTETLSLDIPRKFEGEVLPLGAGYNYQAQLFDHNNGWVGLATEDYYGVTLIEASNFIDITSYPNPVNAAAMVDITFDYALEIDGHAFIRFREGSSNKTAVNIILSAGSGTETLTLEIPADALGAGSGDGYNYQAQIFDHNNSYSNIVTENYYGIIVEEALAPANSITIVNPQTTVTGGRMIDYDLSYTTDEPAAYALIRFKDPNGNLEQAYKTVTDNEGIVTVSVLSPETGGSNYSLQAQLYTTGWSELDTYNLSGITVEEYVPTGENTLEIVDTSTDPINNGSLRQVSVKYNLLQTSKILVEVLDKENPANGDKIGEVSIELPAGNDTIILDLIVDGGFPGTTNRIQALLFDPAWEVISIPEIPYILVGEGDGTITYRGQPYTGAGTQNSYFTQALGDGYYTNYYIANGWEGPLQMKFGPVGSPSWIEYANQNTVSDGHKEFDIKIQKFSWHEDKDYFTDRGYPTALEDINFPLTATLEGQWSPGSGGKGQINMTAWVTTNGDMAGDRSDIIVHAFDNGGDFRKKYDDNTTVGGHTFNNIGEFTATNGLTYQILRTLPGYLGEVASYNLVPDSIVQADPQADYTNDVITSTIDMKEIIDNLIAKESAYTGTQVPINDTWLINGLEWTVVGQSEHLDTDSQMIPSGHGKFTFNDYTIPNLVSTLSTDDLDSKFQNLSIYPNPFKDSFTYKIDGQLSNFVKVELFSMDGRAIKTNVNNDVSYGNSGTVNTGHLSNGMYLVRITSGDVQETKTIIKN